MFRQGKYATGCRFYRRDKDYNFFSSSSHNDAVRQKDQDRNSSLSLTIWSPKGFAYDVRNATSDDSINKMAGLLKVYPTEIGRMYQAIYASTSVIPFVPVLISKEHSGDVNIEGPVLSKTSKRTNDYEVSGMMRLEAPSGENVLLTVKVCTESVVADVAEVVLRPCDVLDVETARL